MARYPARFQLVRRANPCPCAAPAGEAKCRCTSTAKRRSLGRISGPLLDRIDLQAVTSAAQVQDDADVAYEMERVALRAMTLAAAHQS